MERRPLLSHASSASLGGAHPEASASVFSRVTFTWIGELLKRGAAAPLELADLWHVRSPDEATRVRDQLQDRLWGDRPRGGQHAVTASDLWRAIRQQGFGFYMYVAGFCKFLGDALGFVGPICINALIKYVEDPATAWFWPEYFGYIMSTALFASAVLQSVLLHQHHHLVIREAIRVRSALTMVVFEKSLRISSQNKSSLGSGRILNLATTDANRILDLFYFVHYTWAAPLQLVLGMFLLTLLDCTDRRIKFLNDVLRYIRIIKFYSWEMEMLDQVEQIRNDELRHLKRMMVWNAFSQVALQAAQSPYLVNATIQENILFGSPFNVERLDRVISASGLVTIRAFQMVDKCSKDQARRLNTNTKAFLYLNLINRWLGVRLEGLGALITLGVACFVSRDRHGLSSAMAGLLLSYSQSVTALLNWIVRNNIDMENMMNSVERTDEYMGIDTEQDLVLDVGLRRLPCRSFLLRDRPSWPEHGAIQLIDVEVKYHAEGDLVLRGVSVQIKGGEKVGICGRTGAGKSSMLLTLFRLVRCHRGRILIDGVDISQLDLADLRSRMAIIPQEPVLFAATIRFNLDPTGRFDDATLWDAIRKAHLHEFIGRLPAKLDTHVLEGGENFSLGERQLLCLARAILRRSKILCLDEATASMDHATDALIQRSVRQEFAGATVLTIAHRVQTIADYDKVLVLHQGRVAEYGSPQDLLAKPGGEFAAMMASGH
ncbi:hypothetical protein ATCC90586_000884 [Pythium insidiosum]|nr:hypothetical protein ATCC90586_000884 [Pythium insidiosum]